MMQRFELFQDGLVITEMAGDVSPGFIGSLSKFDLPVVGIAHVIGQFTTQGIDGRFHGFRPQCQTVLPSDGLRFDRVGHT